MQDPAAPIATVDEACRGCDARDDELLWAGREHEYGHTTDAEFDVVRCRSCGLARLNPRPDVSELDRIYPPDYYAYGLVARNVTAANHRLPLTEHTKRRVFQHRLHQIVEKVTTSVGPLRLLDVGCADGRMLDWAKAGPDGARIETHGIDMNEAAVAAARARGHRAVVGRFELDHELEPGTFDLLLASHVIEHVEDPGAFTRRAAELLRPGGLFVVETPNIDSSDARHLKGLWGGNHFPRHWTFYGPETIAALAERCGLEVAEVSYEANPIFWNWTMHAWASSRFPSARWPDRLFPPVKIFEASARNFVALGVFTVVDVALKMATGRTASMSVLLRKPL